MATIGNQDQDWVLILRTCAPDGTSRGGSMQWPESGPVTAPDWDPSPSCGQGLHGFLWGEGNGELADWTPGARWLVARVPTRTIVDRNGKVKFPSAEVVHTGDRLSATAYLLANGGAGRAIIGASPRAGCGGTAIAGYRGSATAEDGGVAVAGYLGEALAGDQGTAIAGGRGRATAGEGGTARVGEDGVATAGSQGTAVAAEGGTAVAGDGGTARAGLGGSAIVGDAGTAVASARGTARAGVGGIASAGFQGTAVAAEGGTAIAGDQGTVSAGPGGVLVLTYWDGRLYQTRVATVRGRDGHGQLEPDTPYRIGPNGEWAVAT